MKKSYAMTLSLLVLWVGGATTPAVAQSSPSIIHCPPSVELKPTRSSTRSISKSDFISITKVDQSGIIGKAIYLPLHDSSHTTGILANGFEYTLGGWYGWGLLEDEPGGYFTISTKGRSLYSTIYRGDEIFLVRKSSSALSNESKMIRIHIDSAGTGLDVTHMPGYKGTAEKLRTNNVWSL